MLFLVREGLSPKGHLNRSQKEGRKQASRTEEGEPAFTLCPDALCWSEFQCQGQICCGRGLATNWPKSCSLINHFRRYPGGLLAPLCVGLKFSQLSCKSRNFLCACPWAEVASRSALCANAVYRNHLFYQ